MGDAIDGGAEGHGFCVAWTRHVGDLHPVLVQDGLVVLSGPGRLALVEADTGFELWDMDVPGEHPAVIEIVDDEIAYFVDHRHLTIDIDLGEVIAEHRLEVHAGERTDAWSDRTRTEPGPDHQCRIGRFSVVVHHRGLRVSTTDDPPFAAAIDVARHHDHWPAVVDPDLPRAYVVLPDGSLWCFTADGTGIPVDAGTRSRETPLVELVDALHVRGTNELGLRARLAPVAPAIAGDAVLDWAVGAAGEALRAAGFDDEAAQLDDIGSLAGWDLLPEEANAVGEVLSAPWDDDLDRRAGEEAAVIWTLMASALAGDHAVRSRSVLLVERSRVLASHPAELPLHEVGGAYPYLISGTDLMDRDQQREVERVSLGLLAAAGVARCADLVADPDDLINAVRAAGLALVDSLVDVRRQFVEPGN